MLLFFTVQSKKRNEMLHSSTLKSFSNEKSTKLFQEFQEYISLKGLVSSFGISKYYHISFNTGSWQGTSVLGVMHITAKLTKKNIVINKYIT